MLISVITVLVVSVQCVCNAFFVSYGLVSCLIAILLSLNFFSDQPCSQVFLVYINNTCLFFCPNLHVCHSPHFSCFSIKIFYSFCSLTKSVSIFGLRDILLSVLRFSAHAASSDCYLVVICHLCFHYIYHILPTSKQVKSQEVFSVSVGLIIRSTLHIQE